MAIPLLPSLNPAPYQIPFVDPKTGMMTDAWQRWHIDVERVIFGVWRSQVYDAANFTTNNAGITWTVPLASYLQCDIFQMGPFAVVLFFFNGGTVSADVASLRFFVPTLRNVLSDSNATTLNKIRILDGGGIFDGFATVNHPSGSPNGQVMISLRHSDLSNFLAASPAIVVQGCVIFQCQSLVVP